MDQKTYKQKQWLSKFSTPLYSPRTSYSKHLKQIDQLKINMTINIDKYVLGNLKTQFQKRGKQMNILQFIYFSKKFLKDWNLQLYGRQTKIYQCLINIWKQIDIQNKGKISWEQFNSKIIQTGLNLKGFSNNHGFHTPVFKQLTSPISQIKTQNPIMKMIYIPNQNKIAYFRQQSISIDFFLTQNTTNNEAQQTKSLILPQKQLKVQTLIKVKNKSNLNDKKGHSKMIKKDLKVSSYKNTVIDAIYLNGGKYNMLLVSCSDKFVRAYDVSGNVPSLASQPQNEDQAMVHQFPVEIFNMTWDYLNEVIYATGKNQKIYQWMLKTDSERQLFDQNGHSQMVSVLLMMPKLHLLTTGGFDGKLILWDTVGQSIKCKYEQHTRAISSIIFNESLILLFTAAYDHKICIWNPYISSLIHKIQSVFNVIGLGIIPRTNYLLCLDSGGTVKIRQTDKFTHVASFSIFRTQSNEQNQNFSLEKQKQQNISMCAKTDGATQYYFGTQKIIGYEYYQIQKSTNQSGGVPFDMKYRNNYFSLFTPIKNHLLVWDLLTGTNSQTLYDMCQADIAAFQIIQELNIMIIGDFDGNVILRKLNDGILVSKLYKFRMGVTQIKWQQIQRNDKQKHLKKTFILFCGTQQGQIVVFKCNPKTSFQLYKTISFKKDYKIATGSNLIKLSYLNPKNILIAYLSTNQLLFIDVQKNSLMVKLQMGKVQFKSFDIIKYNSTNYLITINQQGKLFGFYLPPHAKKFKVAFQIESSANKIIDTVYSQKNQMIFILTQSSNIISYQFKKTILQHNQLRQSAQYAQQLSKALWRINFVQKIKKMILIQNDQILILLTVNGIFYFIYTNNGELICQIKYNLQKNEKINKLEPLLYLKEKTEEVFIPNQNRYIQIQLNNNDIYQQINKIINPSYLVSCIKDKYTKNFNKLSNPKWSLNLNYGSHFQKKIQQIKQIKQKTLKCQKQFDKIDITSVQKKLSKALELQKKWEKDKQFQQQAAKTISEHNKKIMIENKNTYTNTPIINKGKSLGSLWKLSSSKTRFPSNSNQTKFKKRKSVDSMQKNDEQNQLQNISSNDPLIRLGLALKSISKTTDKKAENFIQLAKKKQLKFPKISNSKIKLQI